MRFPVRLYWACEHSLHSSSDECVEHARSVARVEFFGPADRICDRQWCGERRVLQHNAYGGGIRVWESTSGRCDGDDCDWMGWRVLVG